MTSYRIVTAPHCKACDLNMHIQRPLRIGTVQGAAYGFASANWTPHGGQGRAGQKKAAPFGAARGIHPGTDQKRC